jgi:hypothetical protein
LVPSVELESTTIVSTLCMSSKRIDSRHLLTWLREFQVVMTIDSSGITGFSQLGKRAEYPGVRVELFQLEAIPS